jgi:hypothetical protein
MLVNAEWEHLAPRSQGNFCRLGLASKATETPKLTIDFDECQPLVGYLAPRYASISRRRPAMTGSVLHVTSVCDDAQIRPSTVQLVAVPVIALATVCSAWQVEQLSMEVDNLGVLSADNVVSVKTPCPLTGPLGIGCVDDGIGAQDSAQRNHGYARQIILDDDRKGQPHSSALMRAEGVSRFHPRWLSHRYGAASRTRNGNTGRILSWHREPPTLGVGPRSGDTDAGTFRV